jgi:hypothetical protein
MHDDPINRLGLEPNAQRVLSVLLERAMRELPDAEAAALEGGDLERRTLAALREQIVRLERRLAERQRV